MFTYVGPRQTRAKPMHIHRIGIHTYTYIFHGASARIDTSVRVYLYTLHMHARALRVCPSGGKISLRNSERRWPGDRATAFFPPGVIRKRTSNINTIPVPANFHNIIKTLNRAPCITLANRTMKFRHKHKQFRPFTVTPVRGNK